MDGGTDRAYVRRPAESPIGGCVPLEVWYLLSMLFRRRKLPPELRQALTAAERADRVARRPGLWRRRLAMVLPGALVPSLLIIIGYLVWQPGRGAPPTVALPTVVTPSASQLPPMTRPAAPAIPRVIYGTAPPASEAAAPAGAFTVRVAVVDGDTLATGSDRLRINGIDAPEMHQMCERGGALYACGEAARAAMARIVGNGAVTCEYIGVDRYGRRVVRCAGADGRDIAAALVGQGWAMAYRQYSMDYVAQEETARAQRLGLWAGRFDAPWDWRHRQRQ